VATLLPQRHRSRKGEELPTMMTGSLAEDVGFSPDAFCAHALAIYFGDLIS
jgi:hypothetical protein